MKSVINIEGMMCGKCAERVAKVLTAAGAAADVSLEQKCASVEFDESKVTLDELKQAVYDAGYDVI